MPSVDLLISHSDCLSCTKPSSPFDQLCSHCDALKDTQLLYFVLMNTINQHKRRGKFTVSIPKGLHEAFLKFLTFNGLGTLDMKLQNTEDKSVEVYLIKMC